LALEAFVHLLHLELQVKFITVCETIHRARLPFPGYNKKIDNKNSHLATALNNVPFASTWRQQGLSNPSINIYLPDGIHLNDLGNKVLYRSHRGAILYGLNYVEALFV